MLHCSVNTIFSRAGALAKRHRASKRRASVKTQRVSLFGRVALAACLRRCGCPLPSVRMAPVFRADVKCLRHLPRARGVVGGGGDYLSKTAGAGGSWLKIACADGMSDELRWRACPLRGFGFDRLDQGAGSLPGRTGTGNRRPMRLKRDGRPEVQPGGQGAEVPGRPRR
jgi:hypothetical protein